MPSIFNFVEKEGKFFTPIVYNQDNIAVVNGVLQNMGPVQAAGVKGVFAKVRMVSTDRTEAELFAVNTEFYNSSN